MSYTLRLSLANCITFLVLSGLAFAAPEVYVGDPISNRIERLTYEGERIDFFYDGNLNDEQVNPSSIEIDDLNGFLYWTDAEQGMVFRAPFVNNPRAEIIMSGLTAPRGVAVDPARGQLFVSEQSPARIIKSDLNGKNPITLVNDKMDNPTEIVIDAAQGKLYWVDVGVNEINRVNLDGSSRELIIGRSQLGIGAFLTGGLALDQKTARLHMAVALFAPAPVPFLESTALSGGDYKPRELSFCNDETFNCDTATTMEIDSSSGLIFWTNESITRADLPDGQNRVIFGGSLETASAVALRFDCGPSSRDSDGDETPDCADQCPLDAFKSTFGFCGCGKYEFDGGTLGTQCDSKPLSCQEDRDSDKVSDCEDSCPTNSYKSEAGVCGCGAFEVEGQNGAISCGELPFLFMDTVITDAPKVIVNGRDVTIVVQRFAGVRKKLKKLAQLSAASFGFASPAKRAKRLTFRYDVRLAALNPDNATIKKGSVKKALTKRNEITYRGLEPGNYTVNYRAQILSGKKVARNTNFSPATRFTVE